MNRMLRDKLDAFHVQSSSSRMLSLELAELLESVRELLEEVASLGALVPIGSRVTRTSINTSSTYDYLALIPSFPEDTARPPTDLMRLFAGHLTVGLRSSFGVTVRAPTVRFWYRGDPDTVMSIHPALYIVEHSEWEPGPAPPAPQGRMWLYPSGERKWSVFDHAARVKWIDQLDDATAGKLRRVVRLLKAWKYRCNTPIHSYFLECGACDWLNQHVNETLIKEDDLQTVQTIMSELEVKVRLACDVRRDVFILDPSGAIDGFASASAYDDQRAVAEQLAKAVKILAELQRTPDTDDTVVALLDIFGLADRPAVALISVQESPLQQQEGDPFIGISDVTEWLSLLYNWTRLRDEAHPLQEQLIKIVQRQLFESNHSTYWRQAGSVRNGTSVRGYSDCDFISGLPLVTRRNPPSSVLWRIQAALQPLIAEYVEGWLDPPAYVLCPRGHPELSIDILPVVRVTEVERRWSEPRYRWGNPEGGPFEGISGTTLSPWPSNPDDLVFCIDRDTFHPIDPDRHLQWLDHADNHWNGYLRLLVCLLKLWKYRRNVPIRSYYIEMFIARWLSQTHHLDGRNLREMRAKADQADVNMPSVFGKPPVRNASEDLSSIIYVLHEHFRDPLSRDEMPSLPDMSTEDWWARSSPCAKPSEIATILRELRECSVLTARACAAEREFKFPEAIDLWRQFFRLSEQERY